MGAPEDQFLTSHACFAGKDDSSSLVIPVAVNKTVDLCLHQLYSKSLGTARADGACDCKPGGICEL